MKILIKLALLLCINIAFSQVKNEVQIDPATVERNRVIANTAFNAIEKFTGMYRGNADEVELISDNPLTFRVRPSIAPNDIDTNIYMTTFYTAFDVVFTVFSQTNANELILYVNPREYVVKADGNIKYSSKYSFEREFKLTRQDVFKFIKENGVLNISKIIGKNGLPTEHFERLKYQKAGEFLTRYIVHYSDKYKNKSKI